MGSYFAPKSTESMSQFPAGVLTGSQVSDVWAHAKKHRYALPAVNVIGSNSINAVMETANAADSPVIIQFSNGGAKFNAGKSLSMDAQQSAVLGAIAGAHHVNTLAEAYGVSVIFTPTTARGNFFHGWMACSAQEKSTLQPQESRCSART